MRIDIITLFPEMFAGAFDESIIRRAKANNIVRINLVDLREFTADRHRTVDDRPYGGGPGMVLKVEPISAAMAALRTEQSRVLLLSPQGRPFSQGQARSLAQETHLIMICGHYEAVDERVRELFVDEEISIGDYVLSNGSLAAMVVTDAVVRLLPGALGCSESVLHESFGPDLLLDHPHYTRPPEFMEKKVPEVLLSGNHEQIESWRRQQRQSRTAARRPDLLLKVENNPEI